MIKRLNSGHICDWLNQLSDYMQVSSDAEVIDQSDSRKLSILIITGNSGGKILKKNMT